MNRGPYALGTSLLLARMSTASQSSREQQLLARLQSAASDVGCLSPDFATAVYIGLKLHWRVVVCGPTRDRTLACLDALTATIVGVGSEQTLHIHGPIGSDAMTQRFAAIRLGEFTAAALDQNEQHKAWFVLVDTPGDPSTTLQWVEREIGATLRASGRQANALPANMFVLVAAGDWPMQEQRCWLSIAAPEWVEAKVRVKGVAPVGYQRQLLDSQLTGPIYRQRLREGTEWRRALASRQARGPANDKIERLIAASVDAQQQGLWVKGDLVANAHRAIAVLEALQHLSAEVA